MTVVARIDVVARAAGDVRELVMLLRLAAAAIFLE
jgi:hypothetical protein